MQPKITSAKSKIGFAIADPYRGNFFGDIEAPGIVQYHFLLAIYKDSEQPYKFYCSEWSRIESDSIEEPMLGIFSAGSHSSLGASEKWADPSLFLLRAIELLRTELQIEDGDLCDGEAWALTNIVKNMSADGKAESRSVHEAGYRNALRRYDKKLAEYMKNHVEQGSS